MNGLAGKRVLITGGTSGIGRASAEALAREGARVLISGRNGERGAEVVSGIEAAGGSAKFVRADLASADDVRDLAARVTDLDVLVMALLPRREHAAALLSARATAGARAPHSPQAPPNRLAGRS